MTTKILLDLDGTLVKYNVVEYIKNHFHIDTSKIVLRAYDVADYLGVSQLAVDIMFQNQVVGKPDFYDNALETVEDWYTSGIEIYIFTNRLKYINKKTLRAWLDGYDIPYHYIVEDSKWHYNFHIDDYPKKLAGSNSNRKLLFSQSWNLDCQNIHGNLERVNSWEEIRGIVNGAT